MKVAIIVGTRPEIIRLARIVAVLRETFDCVLIHTGQNYSYELNEIFFKDLDIDPPDYYLGVGGGSLAETIGAIIVKVDNILAEVKPDAVLILGDTNSSLAVIPAKRRKIPIFHYEAGNRCFDQRVPEEINRKIVDHTADINLTYSGIAKENLLREGFPMDRVFSIGSPMFEVLKFYSKKIEDSRALSEMALESGKYFLLSTHREENIDDLKKLETLIGTLKEIWRVYQMPIVFSVHPRTEMRLRELGFALSEGIIHCKPFGFTDYIALQKNAYCVLSDSGTITEESAIVGFPALNLRDTHERLEGMEQAAVIMTGFEKNRVLEGIELARAQVGSERKVINKVADYEVDGISEKVARIIFSYTDYVNKKVWNK